jgi:hypothetical protein
MTMSVASTKRYRKIKFLDSFKPGDPIAYILTSFTYTMSNNLVKDMIFLMLR